MNFLSCILTITTADWINIIIASVAFIAAIIALLTVNEIRKQRIHSYHPDINMANFSFYVYKGDFDDEIKTVFLYSYKTKKEEKTPINGFNELTIDINNIGFGVAKDVSWHWRFDLNHAEKALSNNDIVWWRKKDDFLSIDSKELNVEWTYDIDEYNQGGSFNFILPYSNENRKNEIVIPSYFIDMYWLYMVTELILKSPKAVNIDFPPIELHVSYTDIHSEILSKVFFVNLQFDFLTAPSENSNELAKFRFEITEKNK
jgi:hypothetical protein